MKKHLATVLLVASAATCLACGSTTTSPSAISTASGEATIGFSGLTEDGVSVTTYSESGFTMSMSGEWRVRTDYGHPAPFVQFWAESGGSTETGEIQLRAAGSVFYFKSVDLYSSITPIPYAISGMKNSRTVFTVTGTVPNTFGNFRTVVNPHAAEPIDTLSITLTNAVPAGCRNLVGLACRNPMGPDSIVLTSMPSTPTGPTTFSLSGQITDSATDAGISDAAVLIRDGPNGGGATRTDASGNYSLADLLQSGFTVTASAQDYESQSKGVTLTSNQSLSFQLTRTQPPTPTPPGATVIGFNGLAVNDATVTTYSESGFTVSTASGAWVASTTGGHPAPFIRFFAEPATTVTGEIRVAADGSPFRFASIDLYASTTPIPYTIKGFRNSSTVFTVTDTVPNTFGSFRTVANSRSTSLIDTLSIVLTNAASPSVGNPMGLDTIVLVR